jgi:hypothetical protein
MVLCDSSYLGYLHRLYKDEVKLQKINLSVENEFGFCYPPIVSFLDAINQSRSEDMVILTPTLCKQFKISIMVHLRLSVLC